MCVSMCVCCIYTTQALAFLAHLAEARGVWGPFLVVSPASTLHNWDKELSSFTPGFKVRVAITNDPCSSSHGRTQQMYRPDAALRIRRPLGGISHTTLGAKTTNVPECLITSLLLLPLLLLLFRCIVLCCAGAAVLGVAGR
jgi:hypothetical protein